MEVLYGYQTDMEIDRAIEKCPEIFSLGDIPTDWNERTIRKHLRELMRDGMLGFQYVNVDQHNSRKFYIKNPDKKATRPIRNSECPYNREIVFLDICREKCKKYKHCFISALVPSES